MKMHETELSLLHMVPYYEYVHKIWAESHDKDRILYFEKKRSQKKVKNKRRLEA